MRMQESLTRLDALSEMMALSSYGNTKNLLVTGVEVKGPVDEDAVKRAVQLAAKGFPQLVSRIREIKKRGRYYLAWDYDPQMIVPLRIMDMSGPDRSGPVLEGFLERITPVLDRDWDLFNEGPAEFHVVRLSKDHHIFAPVIHHVASDAGTASEFGRGVLAHYHEILTGRQPDWACENHAMSGARKRRVQVKKPNLKDLLVEYREALTHCFEKPALPVGSGSPTDRRQYHVKRVLSEEETEQIGKLRAEKGVSLVDILLAGTNLAVDEWNEARSVPPGILTTSMSVNMKGRFQGFERANNSALMFFKSKPEERQDLAAFARAIALTRIKFFRKHMDYKFFQNVSRMTSMLRLLPFRLRRKVVNSLMNHHQFSAAVTFLGVMWPETRNGKPTADSCLTYTGDVSVDEVHGVGYKLLSNTPILLIVYAFRNKLNLVLHVSGTLFTREESAAFMDVVMKNITDFAYELPVSHSTARSAG
jgi:NRPS condensation-like uncharacterized protein